MKTLNEAFAGFGYGAKLRGGDFGMEIETEVKNEKAYPEDFLILDGADDKGVAKYKTPMLNKWKAMGDGSLRNYGIEFIFKEPYSFQEALKAIDIFEEGTKKVKFIEGAPGTSVHVHVNMWNKTFLTMGNFCTLYILFENLLTEFAGETRRSNLFSLPTRCAEPTVWNIVSMFEGIEKGNTRSIRFSDEDVKYAALNLASLSRLGSLEVRMMRGTTRAEELKDWIRILNRLLLFSMTDGLTPRDVMSEFRTKNIDFLDEVFGDQAELLKIGDPEFLVYKNLYFAGSISSSVKDWKTLGDKYEKDLTPSVKKIVKKKMFEEPAVPNGNAFGQIVAAAGLANQFVEQFGPDFHAAPPPPNWDLDDLEQEEGPAF